MIKRHESGSLRSRSMGRILAAAMVLFALAATSPADAQRWSGTSTLGVQLRGAKAPVTDASVKIRFLGIGTSVGPEVRKTDSRGQANFVGISPGRWSLEIEHPEYLSFIATVSVQAGKKPAVETQFLEASGSGRGTFKVKFLRSDQPFGDVVPGSAANDPSAPGDLRRQPTEGEFVPLQETSRNTIEDRSTLEPEAAAEPEAALVEPETQSVPEPKPEPAEPQQKPQPAPEPELEVRSSPAAAPKPEPAQPPSPSPTPPAAQAAIEPPASEPVIAAPEPAPAPPAPAPSEMEAPSAPTPEPEKPLAPPTAAAEVEAPAAPPRAPSRGKPEALPPAAPVPAESTDAPAEAPEVPEVSGQINAEVAPPAVPEPSETSDSPPEAPEAPGAPDASAQVEAKVAPPAAPQPSETTDSLPEAPQASKAPAQVSAEVDPAQISAPGEAPEEASVEAQAPAATAERPVAAEAAAPEQPAEVAEGALRAYKDRSCADCKPGEWAVAATVEVPPGEACRSTAEVAIRRAMRDVAVVASERLADFSGPLPNDPDDFPFSLASAAARNTLAPYLAKTSSCRFLAIVVPKGGRLTGFRFEAADAATSGDCAGESECEIGAARFLFSPGIARGVGASIAYSVFENTGNVSRSGRMNAFFLPAGGWTPPPESR